MAIGWSKDGGVQDQIDASINDAVEAARSQLSSGESLEECAECGEDIPEARRKAIPGGVCQIFCVRAIPFRFSPKPTWPFVDGLQRV